MCIILACSYLCSCPSMVSIWEYVQRSLSMVTFSGEKKRERERSDAQICLDMESLVYRWIMFQKNICDSGIFHRLILFLMLISNIIKYILRFSMDRTMEIRPFLGAEMKYWADGNRIKRENASDSQSHVVILLMSISLGTTCHRQSRVKNFIL